VQQLQRVVHFVAIPGLGAAGDGSQSVRHALARIRGTKYLDTEDIYFAKAPSLGDAAPDTSDP
jgi:cytidylate kinase